MSTLLGSECVAQDPGGLLILGSETTYFLWSPFRFEWVCLFITFMFCLIMAFHIATFNKSHGFWTYETHWFSATSGKYEHKWICPFWIKCSIFTVHFSFFRERHLFLIFLSLRLTCLFLSFFFTCLFLSLSPSHSPVSLFLLHLSISLSFSVSLACFSLSSSLVYFSRMFLFLRRSRLYLSFCFLYISLSYFLSTVFSCVTCRNCLICLHCRVAMFTRLDWLSGITWDGFTRMQLVCAFPLLLP